MSNFKQPFFSRGEISPRLYGRVDTAAYQSALRTARNVIVGVGGGVMNRPGTLFITPCKRFDKYVRLVPFTFKTNDTCLLEFGDFYMRVIREDFPQLALDAKPITAVDKGTTTTFHVAGHGYAELDEVIVSNVVGMDEIEKGHYYTSDITTDTFKIKSKITAAYIDSTTFGTFVSGNVDKIYEIATPYAAEDLALLKFSQSADVLTLVHTQYPVKELKRFALNDWRLSDAAFVSTVTPPSALDWTIEGSGGSDTVTYTVTTIDSKTGSESLPGFSTVKYTVTGATNANPVKITLGGAHNLADDDFVYLAGISGMAEITDRRFKASNVLTDTLELTGEDGTDYGIFTSAVTDSLLPCFIRVTDSASTPDNLISWTAVDGASVYDVYKSKNGVFGFIGETANTSFEDNNLTPDITNIPPAERNPFRTTGDYPGAVGFYQQRRIFGGSDNNPDTWYASQPGDFSNFSISSPTKDDDAITATLVSGQVNQIKHILAGNSMMMFTAGSEWSVSSGGEVAFSPFTVKQDPQTNWGTAEHKPIMAGNTILFVQEDNRTVRSFGFDFQVDGFKSSELSLLSDHIFQDHGIRDWALARTPYSAAVMSRGDGKAAMLVFNDEQNVVGWTRWDTKGDFETVGVIRVCLEHETPEPDDGIYFVVKRNIQGQNVKYIERVHKRRFLDVRDAFFVDSGASYDPAKHIDGVYTATQPGPLAANTLVFNVPNHGYLVDEIVAISDIEWVTNVDSIGNETQPDQFNDSMWIVVSTNDTEFTLRAVGSGTTEVKTTDFTNGYKSYIKGGVVRRCAYQVQNLHHLEGETVSVLADGFPLRGLTVTNGAITIPGLAGRIHVGLPYTSDVELLDIEPSNLGNSTAQGKMRKISKVIARFDKSRELLIGPNNRNLIPMKRPSYVDQTAQLFTGDREVILLPEWNTNGRVFFRMLDPMPFNLLAVFPDVTITS